MMTIIIVFILLCINLATLPVLSFVQFQYNGKYGYVKYSGTASSSNTSSSVPLRPSSSSSSSSSLSLTSISTSTGIIHNDCSRYPNSHQPRARRLQLEELQLKNRHIGNQVKKLSRRIQSSSSSSSTSSSTSSLRSTKEDENDSSMSMSINGNNSLPLLIGFLSISILYWYILVFGAAVAANDLPLPSFIPLVPGWPPSDTDLIPVVEDSVHFFYISDLLNYVNGGNDAGIYTGATAVASTAGIEQLPPLRLAFFNFAEAWVFSFLPLLIEDKKRLPLPIVLFTWAGALGLTNAFLAPYLTARQFFIMKDDNGRSEQDGIDGAVNIIDIETSVKTNDDKNNCPKFIKISFGVISTLVVGYAALQATITTITSPNEWNEFFRLVLEDRTHLAFAVDLVLFSIFQFFLLGQVCTSTLDTTDNDQDDDVLLFTNKKLPFLSLLTWLYE